MIETCMVTVRRGSLHFTQQVYDSFFGGLQNVVLLRDEENLLVLPVRHQASGGYVIKLRNAAGDRTVSAADFFRANGIEDDIDLTLPARWQSERAALVVASAFCAN